MPRYGVRVPIGLSVIVGVALMTTLALMSGPHSASGAPRAAATTPTASDLVPNPVQRTPGVGPVYPYPPGVPAIAVKSSTGPGPNFTVVDVAAYVSTTLMAYQTPGSAPNQLVRAEFLTAAEVSQRLHGFDGRPPETLMCLAYVHGDFTVTMLGTTGKYVTSHPTEGWQLFDAVTGNLLAESP